MIGTWQENKKSSLDNFIHGIKLLIIHKNM